MAAESRISKSRIWMIGGSLAGALLAGAVVVNAQGPGPSDPNAMPPAPPTRGNPIRFVAKLDGAQSEAVNSTDISTRTGSGMGFVSFDPVSGALTLEASFQGLIANDITLGDPAVNPDGSTPGPGTINGNALMGGGLFLFHFHVGAPGKNGPIPVDIIAPNGPVPGVTTDPSPLQRQAAGRVTGTFNINDIGAATVVPGSNPPRAKPAGILLNGVPIDGREDTIRDPFCLRCGFIEGMLSGNAYLNIHTFNNPFGEIRGQLIPAGCDPQLNLNTLDALRNAVDALAKSTDPRTVQAGSSLQGRLAQVQTAIEAGNNEMARQRLAEFAGAAALRSPTERLPLDTANNLICGATNVLISLPVAPDQDDLAETLARIQALIKELAKRLGSF
jgi:hypothetical protein